MHWKRPNMIPCNFISPLHIELISEKYTVKVGAKLILEW